MVVKRADGSASQVPDEVEQARLDDAQDARDERAALIEQTSGSAQASGSALASGSAQTSRSEQVSRDDVALRDERPQQARDAQETDDEAALARAVHERDPRAIARASLDAGRNVSLWWTSAGVVVALVVSLVVGTRAGAYTLAGVLVACAVARLLLPSPGPLAISVRARWIDVTILGVLAASIGLLAQLLPGNAL